MNAEEIERVLSKEPEIEPSPTFALRVMHAVQRESDVRRSPFPPARHLWLEWTSAALLALVSTVSASELHNTLGAVPTIGLDVAMWLSLILPCSVAFGWWSARPFHRQTAR